MPDHPDAADGDSDGMDVDDSIPKPSKSISSLSLSLGHNCLMLENYMVRNLV